MIILLSPAKTLDEAPAALLKPAATQPAFEVGCLQLVGELKKLPADKLKAVLKDVSAALASLNANRYKEFEAQPSKQCVLAYDGPAYKGLQASAMSNSQLLFAQDHLRILSGLYGLLRPLDAIRPYRLDMGCKVACGDAKDLYAFWSARITAALNEQLAAQQAAGEEAFIVNVASQEYFKAVDTKALQYPVYTVSFPGPSVYAKQARGLMARYIIINSITTPEALKGFTGSAGEYRFDARQSSEHEFVFVRGAAGKAPATAGAAGSKRKAAAEKEGAEMQEGPNKSDEEVSEAAVVRSGRTKKAKATNPAAKAQSKGAASAKADAKGKATVARTRPTRASARSK